MHVTIVQIYKTEMDKHSPEMSQSHQRISSPYTLQQSLNKLVSNFTQKFKQNFVFNSLNLLATQPTEGFFIFITQESRPAYAWLILMAQSHRLLAGNPTS